jgi:pantothenate kinase-related protein Tda10
MIFKEIKNEQTKYQILILLKNIIMRNWVKKNNQNFIATINFKIKEEVREELIGIYRNSWKLYYKQFN